MGKAREREVLSWWKTSIMPSVVSSEMKEGEGLEKGVIALMEFFPVPMRHPMMVRAETKKRDKVVVYRPRESGYTGLVSQEVGQRERKSTGHTPLTPKPQTEPAGQA